MSVDPFVCWGKDTRTIRITLSDRSSIAVRYFDAMGSTLQDDVACVEWQAVYLDIKRAVQSEFEFEVPPLGVCVFCFPFLFGLLF